MTGPQIKIARVCERDVRHHRHPPEDPYHTGTLLVTGRLYRISGDGEPEAWRAWLFPAAGGWAHITQSCEAVDADDPGLLRQKLQQRADRKGAWWH